MPHAPNRFGIIRYAYEKIGIDRAVFAQSGRKRLIAAVTPLFH
jgi:hypothetical protein